MLWSSVVFAIDWRKYLCKTSKITCRHASNQQTRNTTCRNIQYCYLLWSREKVQSIEITLEWNGSFIIWFRDTLHFTYQINNMTMTHMNIEMSTGSDWIGKVFIVIGNGNWCLQTGTDSEQSENQSGPFPMIWLPTDIWTRSLREAGKQEILQQMFRKF